MREDVALLLLGAALIFSFLGLLAYAVEECEGCGTHLIGLIKKWWDAQSQEERRNEKALRWVNKSLNRKW